MTKFIISSLVIPSLLLLGLTTANSSDLTEEGAQNRSRITSTVDPNDNCMPYTLKSSSIK